jgi:hypothetical protein
MRLSIISPDLGEACYIYRGRAWTQLGIDYRTYDGKKGFHLFDAALFGDAILMCRPWNFQHVSIAQTIKDLNKLLILDFDDDYTCLNPYNPNAHHFADCLPHLQSLCRLADHVTVATQPLAIAATEWGAKRVTVIPNAIDDSLKGIYRAPERTKSVIWRGSNTHCEDIESSKQTFFDFANRGYELVFFGDKPNWVYQVRHKHYGVTDYSNLLATMAKTAAEYFLFPLVDNKFNRAKSDIAAQEAWLCGCKLIHSNIGEFKGLPEVGTPRWLSEVNHLRSEVLNSL